MSDEPTAGTPPTESGGFGRQVAHHRPHRRGRRLAFGGAGATALALLSAMLVGIVIIAVTDIGALRLWFEDPEAAFSETRQTV